MMTEQTQGCQGSDTLNSKQQASYDDTLSMSMTTRAAWLSVLLASALVTGCASGGAVPRPLPFPGANPPPASPDDSRPDSTVSVPPAGLLATALALRGTPYLNGGSEPSRGFDCSGFVQWVFAQHGARGTIHERVLVVPVGWRATGRDLTRSVSATFVAYPFTASEILRSGEPVRTRPRRCLRRRRHAGSSVVALSARPPMLSPMTTMSHSGRL
jgi:hypothetical protein